MTSTLHSLQRRIARLEDEQLERANRDPAEHATRLIRSGGTGTAVGLRALLRRHEDAIHFMLLMHAYEHRPDSHHFCLGLGSKAECFAASILAIPPGADVPEEVRARYLEQAARPNPHAILVANRSKNDIIEHAVTGWAYDRLIVLFMNDRGEGELRRAVAEMDAARFHQLLEIHEVFRKAVKTGQKRTPLRLPDEPPGRVRCVCLASPGRMRRLGLH